MPASSATGIRAGRAFVELIADNPGAPGLVRGLLVAEKRLRALADWIRRFGMLREKAEKRGQEPFPSGGKGS